MRGFAEEAEPTDVQWADVWDHAMGAGSEVAGFEVDLMVAPPGASAQR